MKRAVMGRPAPGARLRGTPGGGGPAGTLDLALHFEGLAHPTRIAILERLAAAVEMRVTELAEICKVSQPRMSWHLRTLRRSGLIATRRDGREVFCRIDRVSIAGHLRSFARLLDINAGPDPAGGGGEDGGHGPASRAPGAAPPTTNEVTR
ncbi:MAG TPA: metalloregulator ArsR/SmtB family transcription factor [Candidatus Dormibacteraeota bacterium]|nr:metalloregulator ArsR/SmtB family transcription factor [Candidatus Dormibacteraeota bacterium]